MKNSPHASKTSNMGKIYWFVQAGLVAQAFFIGCFHERQAEDGRGLHGKQFSSRKPISLLLIQDTISNAEVFFDLLRKSPLPWLVDSGFGDTEDGEGCERKRGAFTPLSVRLPAIAIGSDGSFFQKGPLPESAYPSNFGTGWGCSFSSKETIKTSACAMRVCSPQKRSLNTST